MGDRRSGERLLELADSYWTPSRHVERTQCGMVGRAARWLDVSADSAAR